jgi:hypothetical protein
VGQRGYPVKVALVGGADDVAETPELFKRPQRHADVVASEVQLEAPVVVVSPHGLGVAGPKLHSALEEVDVPREAGGDQLARTAIVAVPPATALRATAAPEQDESGGVNVPLIVGLFAIVFVPSVLLFEVWTRARRPG